MPYPHQHAARMISPERFEKDSFRTKSIANGISIIVGRLKGQTTMTTQTYRFDSDVFSAEQARKWLKDHNLNPMSFEPAVGEKKKIQSLLRLDLQAFQALSPKEILAIIPTSVVEEIKKDDPHPFFQAYTIAHEGESNPTVLGAEQKPIRWFRKAIQSIRNVVLKGVKFFLGHNEDNSTEGREELGEVVADTQRMVDGKLHHVVVGYFPSRERVEDLDVCSVEATANFWDYAKEYVAGAIEKVTGIALCNSRDSHPAFSGARRVGLIQAFTPARAEAGDKGEAMELQTVPTDEMVKELKRRQTKPTEIFSAAEILAVDEVKAISQERDGLKVKVADVEKTVETMKQEKEDAVRKAGFATAKDRLTQIAKDQKATDRQIAYLMSRFSDKIADVTDEGLKAFVDEKFAEYKANAEFFGEKGAAQTSGKREESGKQPEKPEDYMDPEFNELIPKENDE